MAGNSADRDDFRGNPAGGDSRPVTFDSETHAGLQVK